MRRVICTPVFRNRDIYRWGETGVIFTRNCLRLFELTVENVKKHNRAYSQKEMLEAIEKAIGVYW